MLSNVAIEKMGHNNQENNINEGDTTTQRSSTIKKELVMAESKDLCTDPNYPYFRTSTSFTGKYCTKQDIPFDDSISKKEFCYIKDKDIPPSVTNQFHNMGIRVCDTNQTTYNHYSNENKRKYKENITLDRNQLTVDNNKTPIHITMSCNQGSRRGYYDEYGYSGYGTSNPYKDCVYNNRKYNDNTLHNWYGDMSASNNVYRRRQQWEDTNDYRKRYTKPHYSLTHTSSNNSEIGAPYSSYTPYSDIH